jgi:hypothetical protein
MSGSNRILLGAFIVIFQLPCLNPLIDPEDHLVLKPKGSAYTTLNKFPRHMDRGKVNNGIVKLS